MRRGLLLEIGTEEMPARFISQALDGLREGVEREMGGERIGFGAIRVMGTPRRLALYAELDEEQGGLEEVKVGPPKKVAFDPEGRPTKAAIGFAEREGVGLEALEVIATDKGEYLGVRRREKGKRTIEVLAEVLPRLILSIPFPKSMRWSDLEIRFARPIHWVVALFGEEVVPFAIGNIVSGAQTRGHRFLAPAPFTVKGLEDYIEGLRRAFVIVDPGERMEMIRREVEEAAKGVGGRPLAADDLLEEILYLVEYPVAIAGGFDRSYLELPQEVLITAMEHHQRYIPVVDGEGRLLAAFVAVANIKSSSMDIIRRGNERVLQARLADARFFFEEDQRVPLEGRLERLKGVVFQAKLGTVYEKVMRVKALSERLAGIIAPEAMQVAARGALLCKADLTTEMVGEFPELQGVMGREYALRGGEDPAVAQAIYEHYLPRFSGDKLPDTDAGAILSIADKIDTVVGCFGAGLIPTGTSDPFALRRQTLGVIQIILAKGYRLSLREIFAWSAGLLAEKIERPSEAVIEDVLAFFKGRFAGLLTSQGYAADVVDGVLACQGDDLVDARARIEALARFRERGEYEPVAVAFKRVANILRGIDSRGSVNPELFEIPEEGALHESYKGIVGKFTSAVETGDYEEALAALAALRGGVDAFFDRCFVMVDDIKVRQNRLALLGEIAELFSHIADFSRLGIGEGG